jgi:hypothetical protein
LVLTIGGIPARPRARCRQSVTCCLGVGGGAGAVGIERPAGLFPGAEPVFGGAPFELVPGVEPVFGGAPLELVPGAAPVLVDALVELVPGAWPLVVVVWLVDLLLLPQATSSAPPNSATSTHAVNFRIDIPISFLQTDARGAELVGSILPVRLFRRPRLPREYERSDRTRSGRGQSARAKRVRSHALAPGAVGGGELGRARQVLRWRLRHDEAGITAPQAIPHH